MAHTTWFTSDLHFGHAFMARLRGYDDLTDNPVRYVAQHDADLVRQWNEKIAPNDTVWVLGDFSFHNVDRTLPIFQQLHGREKHLTIGNHDAKRHTRDLPWSSVQDFARYKEDRQTLYLFHYPMLTWPNAHKGTWHLHGHSHGNLQAPESTRMDVGPDSTGQIAMSFDEVREIMQARTYDFIDHHND